MSVKQALKAFFQHGGEGTNEQLAKLFNVSETAIRVNVQRLRGDGMSIVKEFPNRNASLTVYSYKPMIREGLHPLRGRPTLPR